MADPFSGKNESDRKAAEKTARDAAQKQVTTGAQTRIAASKKAAERPPSWDIGYPWPEKFYAPRR